MSFALISLQTAKIKVSARPRFLRTLPEEPERPGTRGWGLRCCRYMDSCQNRGPFLGTLHNRCRNILGTPKGTIILTTTHIKL